MRKLGREAAWELQEENKSRVEEFKEYYRDKSILTVTILKEFKFSNHGCVHGTAKRLGLEVREKQIHCVPKIFRSKKPEVTGTIAHALALQKKAKIVAAEAQAAMGQLRFEVSRENELYIVDGPDGIELRAPKEVWNQWLSTAPQNLRKALGPKEG